MIFALDTRRRRHRRFEEARRAHREALFPLILESALSVSIAFASAEEIDRYNIRGATLRAMARAVAGLSLRRHFALIDGRDVRRRRCVARRRAIIDGDALCLSIAAASIVAKVARDRLMARLDRIFPAMDFRDHAGYATLAHARRLHVWDPRRSIAAVSERALPQFLNSSL